MTTLTDSLDRGRLRVVCATIVINVLGVSLLTCAPWSDWRTGLALNLMILGELGIAVTLALLAAPLRRSTWRTAVLAGLAGGAAIFLCYAAAYALTDGLPRAK